MMRVVIESPYGSRVDGTIASPDELARNITYAKACMLDSLRRGEAPFLSHLLYPLVLDDGEPDDRRLGILAGHAWAGVAEMIAVYLDYGMTPGMKERIEVMPAGMAKAFRYLKEPHRGRRP